MVVAVADIGALLAQLAAKDAEISRLREELAAVRAELEQLRAQGSEANARIGELITQVAKANDRIGELLVIAQRKKRGAPKPPPPEPPALPTLPDDQRLAFEERPRPSVPPEPPPKEKKPVRPTGRKPLPAHLPVVESVATPPCCSTCQGSRLQVIDEVVEEKLDVVAHQRIRRTRRKTCRCQDCGARTTAEALPSPFPRSKVTCEWLAWLVVQKFQLAVPLDRVRRYLGVQGVALAMSFLVTMTEKAADLLDAIDGEHWKQLLAGDHLASDGTGFKVQIREVGLHDGYLEVYHWGDTVVFQYEAEKGGGTQSSKLTKFTGTLLVDAESRYNQTFATDRVIEAGCNAHGRRKFRDAEAVQPVLAVEGGRFVSSWFDLDQEGRDAGLVGDDLRRWRRERIAPEVERFRAWMDAVEPSLPPGDSVAKVIRYYRNHWAALTRFLDDPALPLDNSKTEREFQFVAKIRLNSLFAGGTEGAHRAAVLLGIAATCRRLGVDLQAYLTWVFVRMGTHRHKYDLSAVELTPAAYARAHPAA
jgi:transposase